MGFGVILANLPMKTFADIQPGQTVGRYEFLVPIAQGGMASVWAARLKGSRGFSKTVAVKTMLPTVSDEPQFEQMFLDEASIASRIRHPNVAEILDLGEQDDLLYLVMEWVDGEPLSSIRWVAAKHGGIPLPIAVRIVADACSGLHAVHELKDEFGEAIGLVHRDISPQNLLVGYDGVVKLVDFGVAKAAGRTAQNTSVGEVKGKPPYMSPEQALGMVVDRRTDLFALGIVLYQVTTGKHPLRGETDILTLQNIISNRTITPPSCLVEGYPAELEAIVLRALQRDPVRRFQTASEMGAALEELFVSELPRVRSEDVGKYVSQLLGEAGEDRRAALRSAIQLADNGAFGAQHSVRASQSEADLLPTTVTRPNFGGVAHESGEGVTAVTGPSSVSNVLIDVPDFRTGIRLRWIVLGVTLIGILAIGVGLFGPTSSSREQAEAPIKSSASPPPVVTDRSGGVERAAAGEREALSPDSDLSDGSEIDGGTSGAVEGSHKSTVRSGAPLGGKPRPSERAPSALGSSFVPPLLTNPGF